jgi:hypothetical protein
MFFYTFKVFSLYVEDETTKSDSLRRVLSPDCPAFDVYVIPPSFFQHE